MLVEIRSEDVAGAARVREQLANGDLGNFRVRVTGRYWPTLPSSDSLPAPTSCRGRDRGEHLVHRTEAELRLHRHRHARIAVGHAPRALQQDVVAARDQQHAGERIPLRIGVGLRRQRGDRARLVESRDLQVGGAFDRLDVERQRLALAQGDGHPRDGFGIRFCTSACAEPGAEGSRRSRRKPPVCWWKASMPSTSNPGW